VEHLQNLRAFDALPAVRREEIGRFVRENAPLYVAMNDESAIRQECVAVMVQWRQEGRLGFRAPPAEVLPEVSDFEQGWAEFRRLFIRDLRVKDAAFLDRVKSKFEPAGPFNTKGIAATPQEMLYALESYLEDPRREGGKWDGRFPTEAYRFLPQYILARRAEQRRAAKEPAAVAMPVKREFTAEEKEKAAQLYDAGMVKYGVFDRAEAERRKVERSSGVSS
jgi:hypothetical protein